MDYFYNDEKGRHLHTLDDKPLIGTSTVCRIIAKPLTWWAAGQAVGILGWLDPRKNTAELRQQTARESLVAIKNLDVGGYMQLLDKGYRAHDATKRKAGTAGTARHATLEEYVKMCLDNGGAPLPAEAQTYEPEVAAFIDWALVNVRRFLWCEVNCYSRELWVGGIADIGYEDMEGKIVAGDHKSSEHAYFDQFIQIAGYDLELSENGGFNAKGEQVFILPRPIDYYIVFPFRSLPFTPKKVYDVEGYRQAFKAALTLYKASQNYQGD